ncbi:MAG: hypothetical protein Q8P28_10985 [Deltaproteobacteria bacterium]|nr:hypothetical protein [Deltaproteobacteria bacterium]
MGKVSCIMKRVKSAVLLIAAAGLLSGQNGGGCAGGPEVAPPPPPPLPVSHWGDNYFYNYEPPKKLPPASIKATVIVVNPFYKDAESSLIDPIYAQVGKGFSKSMGVDLDKIIIAKGMTSVGPYLTLDDVTYPDKKNADITLAPRVFITTDTKYDEWAYVYYSGKNLEDSKITVKERKFEMKIGGWVAYEMREPLSGEKMWVKKLEMEGSVVRGMEIYEAIPVYETRYGGQYNNIPYQHLVRYDQGKMYTGRADAVADALKDYYPVIMEKAWTYLDTDEILNLKGKTKEIRELKRY